MLIAGVHSRIKAGRHIVGFAVVDDSAMRCVAGTVWRGPAGETAAGVLDELYVRAGELLRQAAAQTLVVWTTDPAAGGAGNRASLIEASRAEGAVMAAAGRVASIKAVVKTSGPTVRTAAELDAKVGPSIVALCQRLTDVPDSEPVRSAAAGALAWSSKA